MDVLAPLLDGFDPAAFDAPAGHARLRLAVEGEGEWDFVVRGDSAELQASDGDRPDARLSADRETWQRIARDIRGGMQAFSRGRLVIRDNLHLGVGFLAATSGMTDPRRLELGRVRTRVGHIAVARAGEGPPVVMLHGLGATKASFLPTIAALADSYRTLAIDLPGFGDSAKPLGAPYDPRFFAGAVCSFMDACKIERAHLIGNSMGGRVALEVGFADPERVERIALLAPSLAWLRDRPWTGVVRALRPELGLLQLAPRPIVEEVVRRFVPGGRDSWSAVGVDEFLRAYLTPRGQAAYYAAVRSIYLEEPDGKNGFWPRLRELQAASLFVWGRQDKIVPIGFARHVREALPAAQHVELDCGHVPQLERPREAHAAVERFLAGGEGAT
jgi:pimeloyl-ACP methyl ester carboxylesterase